MWRSLPHHLVRDVPMSTPRSSDDRKRRAIGEPAGEARLLGAGDMIADQRMHAVGADHGVGLGLAAVGEGELDARAALADAA